MAKGKDDILDFSVYITKNGIFTSPSSHILAVITFMVHFTIVCFQNMKTNRNSHKSYSYIDSIIELIPKKYCFFFSLYMASSILNMFSEFLLRMD